MIGNTSMPGIMPQSLQDLFERIDQRRDETIFTIFISYLEIYNEQIRDLLVEGATSLDLRVSSNDTAVVAGLTQHKVDSAEEVCLVNIH
jgi:kinesin family protein 18/19